MLVAGLCRDLNLKRMNTELMFSSKTEMWATPQDFFDKMNEQYDLQFVGNRPFGADWRLFMDLAQQGQKLLDTWDHTE